MTNIQCMKFSYAGNKLHILGSVSTSVQCVHNGRLIGNHHIRARVVLDLKKTFDTNDRTCRIIHIGLCLPLLIFCQTKSDSQHRFTNHPWQLFFSDM